MITMMLMFSTHDCVVYNGGVIITLRGTSLHNQCLVLKSVGCLATKEYLPLVHKLHILYNTVIKICKYALDAVSVQI